MTCDANLSSFRRGVLEDAAGQSCEAIPSFIVTESDVSSVCAPDIHRHTDDSHPEHQAPPVRAAGVPGVSSGGPVHLTH